MRCLFCISAAGDHHHIIVIIFTPKAKHVPENVIPTFEKMCDEFRVKDMIDVVFFNDEQYSCKTNKAAVSKIQVTLA